MIAPAHEQMIYLNGHYVPACDAKISIFDRGFLFADSIYEIVPIYQKKAFTVDEHYKRLCRSLDAINMPNPLNAADFETIIKTLLEQNDIENTTVSVYLQITRGSYHGRTHTPPDGCNPTVVAFLQQPKTLPYDILKKGFSAVTLEDSRRRNCSIKSTSLLANILAAQEASKQDAIEAIFIRDGLALEGTSSNLFTVKNGAIITPPLSHAILGGITRDLIINIAKRLGLTVYETPIKKEDLFYADEIWLTGSTKEICPVVQLDDKTIGTGRPGTVWDEMIHAYYAEKETLSKRQKHM